jgi:hypothetical protein
MHAPASPGSTSEGRKRESARGNECGDGFENSSLEMLAAARVKPSFRTHLNSGGGRRSSEHLYLTDAVGPKNALGGGVFAVHWRLPKCPESISVCMRVCVCA